MNMRNFDNFKSDSYCVGGRHYSGTNNFRGVVTAKGTKMLKGNCTKYRKKKSLRVSDAINRSRGIEKFL